MFDYDFNLEQLFFDLFFLLFLFRHGRTIIAAYGYLTAKPVPIKKNPRYTSKDVSVVIPTTFKEPAELIKTLRVIARCAPAAIFVVTSNANLQLTQTLIEVNKLPAKVLGVPKLSKRGQLLRALREIRTEITVFSDDDILYPSDRYLDHLLACFEDKNVGAAGSRQRTARRSGNFWNFLGISYLERRSYNNISTNNIDGSLSTLSGRTQMIRSAILQTDEFFHCFLNDSWRGRPLNSDDDKFLTRWVYSHGWKVKIQASSDAVIETTLEESASGYTSQLLRWARAHWRGNFTVMENETYWYRSWFGLWSIYIATFQTPSLLIDGLLFTLLGYSFGSPTERKTALISLGIFIFVTKIHKLIPHLIRNPGDIKFIPGSILFSYTHGFLNVYAAFTLTQTQWGSQNLEALEKVRAKDEKEVIDLLHDAEEAPRPRPGRIMLGPDYFSLEPADSE